jgi:hypothetical protein
MEPAERNIQVRRRYIAMPNGYTHPDHAGHQQCQAKHGHNRKAPPPINRASAAPIRRHIRPPFGDFRKHMGETPEQNVVLLRT